MEQSSRRREMTARLQVAENAKFFSRKEESRKKFCFFSAFFVALR
jgi:hypothetical protein